MKAVIILITKEIGDFSDERTELFTGILKKSHHEIENFTIAPDRTHAQAILKRDFSDDTAIFALQKQSEPHFHAHGIDIAILPQPLRVGKFLIADMDSTIIEQECVDELADFAGVKERVSAITEQAMRGELNFNEALIERVALLKGLPVSVLETCLRERVTLTRGGKELTEFMRKSGAKSALVSGGFSFFTQAIREKAGFDFDQSNILETENNTLTGRVTEPILNRASKLTALKAYSEKFNFKLSEAVAVGDGANDLDMIRAAGLGVAFHAKPDVAAQARVNIRFSDLRSLIYLQENLV